MKKIMVVDDEMDITELVCALLEKKGYSVISFNKSKEALEYIERKEVPDLLLLDMRMPDITGPEFYKKTIGAGKFNKMKIIFFSATSDFDSSLLKQKGVLGFVQKPFDIDEFVKSIEKYSKK